ncbi:neprilysin-1-like isoform X1 [Coccinella septempunctata]|uniref:neprilysin-1-like isoform X1 n=1 Tax=Coccinella septempunctata TaxID=41139 RepID=UPI001D08C0FB|nr:neprilysin-1-like isoform X1 [Coccinella septempunctata]
MQIKYYLMGLLNSFQTGIPRKMLVRSFARTFLCLVFLLVSCECRIPFFFRINYCSTKQCEIVGSSINRHLNQSVDPCVNFYRFSCDGWISNTKKPDSEPVWSNWQILSHKINDRVENILNTEIKTHNLGLKKAAKFYNACLDIPSKEKQYLDNLRLLVKDIRGWPIAQDKPDLKDYNWFRDILKITRLLGAHPVFKVSVNIDYKNTSLYTLYIEPGDLIYPLYILKEPKKYPIEMKSYKFWILQSIKYLYGNNLGRNIKLDVSKIIYFEEKLAELMERSKNERFTLYSLNQKFPFKWKEAFKILTLDEGMEFGENDTFIIKNLSYFANVFNFLQRIDPTLIANYLMWYTVRDLSRETGPQMRSLNFMVDKIVLGVKSDIEPRTECLNSVVRYFQNALVPVYLEKYSNEKILQRVQKMVANIKTEFIKLIKRSYWLNEKTKDLAIEKIKYLKENVGYPDWTGNLTKINEFYGKVNLTNNHIHNVVNMKNFLEENVLGKYKSHVGEPLWPGGPFEINAYYSILQNAIFIPLGLLEPPFFNPNVPEALNYGALGSLIGHEISHALDMSGRQANKYGIIGKWWIDHDIGRYEKQAECYENFYDSLKVDGHLTIGENIADNVGIDISFSAFKRLRNHKTITIIPQLETFSKEQLFYLAYSQMWCEIGENNSFLQTDEHAPAESRVLGTLNNENFNKHFHCDTETKAYCKLW